MQDVGEGTPPQGGLTQLHTRTYSQALYLHISRNPVRDHVFFQTVTFQMILDVIQKCFAYTHTAIRTKPQTLGGKQVEENDACSVKNGAQICTLLWGRQKVWLTLGLL